MLCYLMLCCTMLYSAMLCHARAISNYTILYYTILYYTALSYAVLHSDMLLWCKLLSDTRFCDAMLLWYAIPCYASMLGMLCSPLLHLIQLSTRHSVGVSWYLSLSLTFVYSSISFSVVLVASRLESTSASNSDMYISYHTMMEMKSEERFHQQYHTTPTHASYPSNLSVISSPLLSIWEEFIRPDSWICWAIDISNLFCDNDENRDWWFKIRILNTTFRDD